jgi:branched-chain amino acid transport system ATP-binding protein
MLALARALIVEPRLLMLDEPTAGLSPVAMDEIFACIRTINASGVSVLMVEQNARQALRLAHRGYVLATGRNRMSGTGQALLADAEVAASFVGG